MKVDLNQFLESFYEEAQEHIEAMEAALLELESAPDDLELLNTVFRAAHSVKGASATFGVQAVGEFTHVLESILDRMRDGEISVTSETTELLLVSVDVLAGLLSAEQDGTQMPDNVAEVTQRLREMNSGVEAPAQAQKQDSPAASVAEPKKYAIRFAPSREFFHFGLDPLLLLRDLSECGTVTNIQVDDSQLPPWEEMEYDSCYLAFDLNIETRNSESELRDVFLFVDDSTTLKISELDHSPQPASSANPSTRAKNSGPQRESVRVNGERLDDMINQIGELVIGISMVEQEWASQNTGTESAAIVQLSKIVRDLQEQSLSMRMVPIAATFQKMNRIVRDLSSRLGKQICFAATGEDTELDKSVVDEIGDPLIHMVRNSVDHGIEAPEQRVQSGKSAEGRIDVRAYHEGGNIFIELQDDGKGLNLDAIRQKAIAREIIQEEDQLTQQEVCDLIFHAGLSTAQEVSDVSGRGVGMDVVRRNIEALKGSVSVHSVQGEGTTMTVRLPLTLAILDGLLVRLGSEVYIVPLLSVVESFRPKLNEVKRLANGTQVVQVRGEVVPILFLHSIFNVQQCVTDPSKGLLVVVEDHDAKYALLVDDLLGQQQVVIKNLESNFRRVPGIAGATILGDGRVALIVDVVGLRDVSSGRESIEKRPSSNRT